MTIDKPVITVGLLWHSMASGNLGVTALTLSQMVIVREAAKNAGVQVRIVVYGWKLDGAMATAAGCENIEYIGLDARALLSPLSAFRRSLAQCDLVLDVGEGDSFSDIYGIKRLIYLCLSKWLAAGKGRKLILSPQTLGPFSSRLAAAIARLTLRRANLVVARDPLSMAWAAANVPDGKAVEAIDMAFRLPYSMCPDPNGGMRIGLNISGLLYFGGYGGGNSLGLSIDFKQLTHRLIEWALMLPGVEVWLVPHVLSRDIPEEDDQTAANVLMAKYPGLKCAGPFAGPSEAKTFMSGLAFFAGGRMHACIGAFSAGVPIVPLAYSRKFNGLFGSLNYPVLVDCRTQNVDEAFDTVVGAFTQRATLIKSVIAGNQIASQKLQPYLNAIGDAIKHAAMNKVPKSGAQEC